ncbi:SsgA family sporulation/cell division regulator [Streptomyces chartreusis]
MITLPIDLELICGSGRKQFSAALIYDPADPYAVALDIALPEGEKAVWMFGRDLLADGLKHQIGAGRGDVIIWSCTDDALHISLRSDEGAAELHTDPADVDAFLELSYGMVERGHEMDAVDVDAELNEIFGTAA